MSPHMANHDLIFSSSTHMIFDYESVFIPQIQITLLLPRQAKVGIIVYAASVAQAQPAHLRSLVRCYPSAIKSTQGFVVSSSILLGINI